MKEFDPTTSSFGPRRPFQEEVAPKAPRPIGPLAACFCLFVIAPLGLLFAMTVIGLCIRFVLFVAGH
jgi:hypothetical protein